MNHCQPDRILHPNHPDYPTHSGFVITPPLANSSNYRHYVFSDKESPIYKMPANLFRLSNYRGMKNTQILRAEKSLEFGNNIYFTVNPHTNEVLDYELGLPVHVTECIEGLNLVRTIALLPPKSVGKFCWTELFGRIDLSDEMFERLHLEAKHDVPITAWILVDLESDGWDVELICSFYEFIEVAVDDRKIAWDAEWNMNHVNRPTNYYKFDTTDDEDEEEQPLNPIIEKKEEQILDVRLNLEGYLIDSRELFCPELKDYCVEIGLWSKKNAKLDNNYDLLGNKYKFDVYFSDVLQIYIAYYFEDITEKYYDEEEGRDVYDKECWVILEDYSTDKLLQIEIFPSDNYGSFYNTHEKFGLIADSGHVLGPLPLLFAELETYSLWVNVIDTGPGKKLSRFTIAELERQPEETYGLIEEAKNLAMGEIEVKEGSEKKIDRKHKICNEGFVLDDNLTFFSPAYANQKIVLPEMYRQHVKIGQWIKFEALYNKEANCFEIVGGVSAEQPPVPHNKIVETVDGKTKNKYLFKIEAEMIQNPQKDPSKFFLAGCIYNPQYGGLISDPDGKFKKVRKRAKMQKIIVVCVPGGQTLFKLVRMSTGNEQMDSEKQDFLPNNGEDKDEDSEIGLELEDEIDFNEADENEIMQTDYLSESQIRERQIRARDRRRQRDKEEKEIQERLRQLVLEEEINEEFLDPRPSTSAAAI